MRDDFRAAVYAMVKTVPKGKVATYGQVAALVGHPRHARHVGFALASMPANLRIPWHRIINAAGRISMRRKHWDSGSDEQQRVLLEAEGVAFDATGRVSLEAFGWFPPSPRAAAATVLPPPAPGRRQRHL